MAVRRFNTGVILAVVTLIRNVVLSFGAGSMRPPA